MGTVESFDEFVAARWSRLVRAVVLMGADLHTAEDIVQDGLARCYFKWKRIMKTRNPDAYVHRVMINAFIDRRRRFWHRESPVETLPVRRLAESAEMSSDADVLRAALMRLPLQQREVVVLRFFLDLTEQQAADAMNVPIGTVKSRASRALTTLAADDHLSKAVGGGL